MFGRIFKTMSEEKKLVVVAGATGHIGQLVVAKLRSEEYSVRALVRRRSKPEAVQSLEKAGADIFYCDVTNSETLEGATKGAFAVVSCLGARTFDGKDGTAWSIDRDAVLNVWRQTLDERDGKVFVVVASYEGMDSREMVDLSEAKEQAIDAIRKEARDYRIRWVAVRPTAYFRDMVDHIYRKVADGHRQLVIGSGNTKINPIAGEDVAQLIVDCIRQPKYREDLKVGGPDVFTFVEMAQLAAEVTGQDPSQAVRHIPELVVWSLIVLLITLGYVSRWAAMVAEQWKFLLWVSTHDGVGERHGQRHLRDVFLQQAQSEGRTPTVPPSTAPGSSASAGT